MDNFNLYLGKFLFPNDTCSGKINSKKTSALCHHAFTLDYMIVDFYTVIFIAGIISIFSQFLDIYWDQRNFSLHF